MSIKDISFTKKINKDYMDDLPDNVVIGVTGRTLLQQLYRLFLMCSTEEELMDCKRAVIRFCKNYTPEEE